MKTEDILYFDINSGISGDMTIASLLDLDVDKDKFLKELDKLNLSGYEIEISTVQKNGITAKDFKVILEDESHPDHHSHEHDDHGHDHAAYNHSHDDHSHNHQHGDGCSGCGNHEAHDNDHSQAEDSNHEHHHSYADHEHSHEENSHNHGSEHIHRNFSDIKKLINESDLKQNIKNLSIEMFSHVAEAEARVHNKKLNEVHFHEVGAVDSIVDIVGAAILIDMLNPEHIYASPVSIGAGFVDAAHGRIPVPAPATIEILKGTPVYSSGIKSELVTPTGAAIIKTLVEEFIPAPEMEISKIAYGAGKKDLKTTNLLRVYKAKKKVKKSY